MNTWSCESTHVPATSPVDHGFGLPVDVLTTSGVPNWPATGSGIFGQLLSTTYFGTLGLPGGSARLAVQSPAPAAAMAATHAAYRMRLDLIEVIPPCCDWGRATRRTGRARPVFMPSPGSVAVQATSLRAHAGMAPARECRKASTVVLFSRRRCQMTARESALQTPRNSSRGLPLPTPARARYEKRARMHPKGRNK